MNLRRILVMALAVFTFACGLAALAAAINIRTPALAHWRPLPSVALFAFAAIAAILVQRLTKNWPRLARAALGAPFVVAIAAGAFQELRIARLKARVLAAPAAELQAVGSHLLVGFTNTGELEPLILRAGAAGVFIAGRNAGSLSETQLEQFIARLQTQRSAASLPPLWIAADQEGGLVNALSPPLRPALPLASLVHSGELVVNEANNVARDLACVGVNLNLAPVVDRDTRQRGVAGGASQIPRRAISADERLITLAARSYCEALAERSVHCALKHFPGIGPAIGDTHKSRVALSAPDDADLLPFREIIQDIKPWILLSHVTVESLDAARPASASRAVVDILRGEWGFDGVLATDDISMAAYAESFDANVIDTFKAGADILLAAYDPDSAYRALDILLNAQRNDPEFRASLASSSLRLGANPPGPLLCSRTAALQPGLR